MGMDYNMQLVLSGVLNVTQLVGVTSSIWTMDKFGRRPLLLIGSVAMSISHIIIAVLVGLYDDNWPAHRPQGWTSVAFLFLYMLAFGASWGPVPWAMPSGEPKRVYPENALTLELTCHRNLPVLAASQGSGSVDVFELVEQLYNRRSFESRRHTTASDTLTNSPSFVSRA